MGTALGCAVLCFAALRGVSLLCFAALRGAARCCIVLAGLPPAPCANASMLRLPRMLTPLAPLHATPAFFWTGGNVTFEINRMGQAKVRGPSQCRHACTARRKGGPAQGWPCLASSLPTGFAASPCTLPTGPFASHPHPTTPPRTPQEWSCAASANDGLPCKAVYRTMIDTRPVDLAWIVPGAQRSQHSLQPAPAAHCGRGASWGVMQCVPRAAVYALAAAATGLPA